MRALHRAAWIIAAGFFVSSLVQQASARPPFFIDSASPGSFIDIFKMIYGYDPNTGDLTESDPPDEDGEPQVDRSIPDYLEKTNYTDPRQCGGWDLTQKVDTMLGDPGKVAKVTGAPGREGDPLADIPSGMAKRIETGGTRGNGFLFPSNPNDVKGFSTTCDDGPAFVTKMVWDEAQQKRVPKQFHHPMYAQRNINAPCLNYSKQNPDPIPNHTQHDLEYDSYQSPLTEERCGLGADDHGPGFCTWLNMFTYLDCIKPLEPVLDAAGNPVKNPDGSYKRHCPEYGERYICTDGVVNVPDPDMNCHECTGGQCRCGEVEPQPPLQCTLIADNVFPRAPGLPADFDPDPPNSNQKPYESFFRRYKAIHYERAKVNFTSEPTDSDVTEKDAEASCYGFYKEFDPKIWQARRPDRRCTIKIKVFDPSSKDDSLWHTQKGNGIWEKDSDWEDPDPIEATNQRNDGTYDEEEDLWYENLGRAFSLLNEKVFEEDYESDLLSVYLDTNALDRADQEALSPFSDTITAATGSLMRAFDDTGAPRTISFWWQKQETEASAVFHRPVVRMVLPAAWAFGIDLSGSLFGSPPPDPQQKRFQDPRAQTIEVQVEADEDMLGGLLSYLEDSLLLHLEEEPMAVVVPLGSPTEFRSLAQAWCSWHMEKMGAQNCTDAQEPVLKLMNRLNEYAVRIEDVRELRSELARYAGDLLTLQRHLTRPLSTWMRRNLDVFKGILLEQRMIKEFALPLWNEAQDTVNRFHDVTNLPWCMNHRFTTPIYSLLDEWMASRDPDLPGWSPGNFAHSFSMVYLPDLGALSERPKDLVIDLSAITYLTGSLKIPVLKPVAVNITKEIPKPPRITEEHGITIELPALPSMQPIRDALKAGYKGLPKVATGDVIDIPDLPKPMSEEQILGLFLTLFDMNDVVEGMNQRYKKFWDSLKKFDVLKEEDKPWCIKQGDMKPLDCCTWDDELCQHVEMDLLERVTRIGSRPLVQLKEDYQSLATTKMTPQTCLTYDEACVLLHREQTEPKIQWEILGPNQKIDLTERVRSELRKVNLREPVGEVPKDKVPLYDTEWKIILPGMDTVPEIDLRPPPAP